MPVEFLNYGVKFGQKIARRYRVERDKTPEVYELENVFAVPHSDALYGLDGKRIDQTKRVNLPMTAPPHVIARVQAGDDKYEPPEIEIPAEYEVVEEPVHFAGSVWPHYGHFITDGMSRLWDFRPGQDSPILYLNRASKDYMANRFISPVLKTIFDPARRVVSVDGPTLFRRVRAPAASIEHSFRIFDCHDSAHLRVADAVASDADYGRRVYLSRSALREQVRQSVDEVALETRLEQHGYRVVYPERLTLADQIKIFNSAEWIVGTVGSAFHTALFSLPGFTGSLAVLSWSKINSRYFMIDEIKNYSSYYIHCMDLGEIDLRDRVQTTYIKIDMVMDALSDIGALK